MRRGLPSQLRDNDGDVEDVTQGWLEGAGVARREAGAISKCATRDAGPAQGLTSHPFLPGTLGDRSWAQGHGTCHGHRHPSSPSYNKGSPSSAALGAPSPPPPPHSGPRPSPGSPKEWRFWIADIRYDSFSSVETACGRRLREKAGGGDGASGSEGARGGGS